MNTPTRDETAPPAQAPLLTVEAQPVAPRFRRLYRAHGFEVTEGARHIVVRHPEFPELNTTVARHNDLDPAYARTAVRLIDELLRRRGAPTGGAQGT